MDLDRRGLFQPLRCPGFIDFEIFFSNQFDGNALHKLPHASLFAFVDEPHASFRDHADADEVQFAEKVFELSHDLELWTPIKNPQADLHF